MKRVLTRLAFAIVMSPAGAFAVDGVTLINQSTVMAAGGFPYVISQPGSYKLSGNLVAPAGRNGINISHTDVILDLNGFSVSCGGATTFPGVACIFGSVSNIVVKNGAIVQNAPSTGGCELTLCYTGVGMSSGFLEDLFIEIIDNSANSVLVGSGSVIRHSVLQGQFVISCPSIVADTVFKGFSFVTVPGCTTSNIIAVP